MEVFLSLASCPCVLPDCCVRSWPDSLPRLELSLGTRSPLSVRLGELICFSCSLLIAAGPCHLLVTSAPRLACESRADKPPTPALPLLRVHRMPTKWGFASRAGLASGKCGCDIQPSVAGSVLGESGGTVCGRGHGVRLVPVHRSITPSVCCWAAGQQRSRSHWPTEAGMGGRGRGFGWFCSLNKPSCVGKAQAM